METEWDLIVRLCVAGLCGTVIGLDREYRVKDAGFRTHFLVALGSALMMIVSQYGFEGFLATHDGLRLDPSRIAAQVVSGIGFIGARYDHHTPSAGARADHGGEPLGYGRHRTGGRRTPCTSLPERPPC